MFRTFRKVKLVKSNESDKIRSNPEGGKLASGEPDALKGASPVRRREWGDVSKDNAPCSYPTEVMHMIRKGRLHGIKRGDIIAQNLIIATVFGIAA
jgi:hypothetical protein